MILTAIDFRVINGDIGNLESLPVETRRVFDSAETKMAEGFQTINGYQGRKVVWSAGGYWDEGKFQITSIGHMESGQRAVSLPLQNP